VSFKSVFGVVAALLPVGYCGYLLLYFRDVSGEAGPVETGLGPTMLGLGAVGLLFTIPLILKMVRLFAGSPASAARVEPLAEDSTFDADAALARYLARKAAGGGEAPVPPRGPAPRGGGFGRRSV
jgi:hypothetical protein